MGALRVIVPDVDEALTAYAAAGYAVAQRWGPPFAILSSPDGPDVWLAGPGTSAARSIEGLDPADAACARVRQVLEVDDVPATVAALAAAGWEPVGDPLSGPGGAQQLVRRGPVFVEVFSGG
jgi:hypothetical protein